MKVTIQNGSLHGLSRRDVEAVAPLFPKSWSEVVTLIVLCHGEGSTVSTAFYPKQKTMALFWPSSLVTAPTKLEAVEELLVALSIARERGELPERVSKSLRAGHFESLRETRALCALALAENAV